MILPPWCGGRNTHRPLRSGAGDSGAGVGSVPVSAVPPAHTPPGPTVGVSLLVPEPWGSRLQQARLDLGEARARHIPAHITIQPPTPASAGLDAVVAHVERVAAGHQPFPVVLRGTGTFRPVSDVVFIQVARGVSDCEVLQRRMRTGPLTRDLRFPYHPHVTIAHDLPAPDLDRVFDQLAGFCCEFVATHLTVFVHHGDEAWRPVHEVALGPGGDG